MGRPNNDLINDFKMRLEWFSVDRYDGLAQLDMLDWFKQLEVRRSLYQRLTEEFPHFFKSGVERPMIWGTAENFLVDIEENPILNFDEGNWFDSEIPRLKTPVHSTTIEEFYLGELAAKQSRIAQARRFFDKVGELRYEIWRDGRRLDFFGCAKDIASTITSEVLLSGDTADLTIWDLGIEDGPSEEHFFDEDFTIRGWGKSPLHEHLGLKDVGILSIDLNAAESVLVEHFKAAANRLKTEQQKIRAEKLNPADWVRCGLLPYIDLELWRLTKALPRYGEAVEAIPDPLIRDLILREDDSEDSKFASTEHTIRTVTRDYFNRMFAAHSSLFALLQSEAAAQFHNAGVTPRFHRYKQRKRLSDRKKKTKLQKVL